MMLINSKAMALLSPLKVGVGVKGDCEATVHSIQSLLEDNSIPDDEKLVLQVDLQNAHNLVSRESVFKEIRKNQLEISYWIESSYTEASHLVFGSEVILSQTGLHQGDNEASTLHGFASLPVVKKIAEEVPELRLNNVWFQDDDNLVSSALALRKAINILRTYGPEYDLILSEGTSGKSKEVWRPNTPLSNTPVINDINNCITILGAPMGPPACGVGLVDKRISSISGMLDKLTLLQDSHLEYVMLRSHNRNTLLEMEHSPRDRAMLSSVALPKTGCWANSIPSKAQRLHLSNKEFQVTSKYRLGLPVFSSEGACQGFKAPSDVYG